jgi:hypothetical protein
MNAGTGLTVAAFGAGLVATVILAAYLTPRGWWRRANARALAVLAVGTFGIGSLLLLLVDRPAAATAASSLVAVPVAAREPLLEGRSYRVYDDLNLRASSGVGSRRVAVVPAGASVTATGVRDGDWWQVSARVGGREVKGWASSLWLRRDDEQRR